MSSDAEDQFLEALKELDSQELQPLPLHDSEQEEFMRALDELDSEELEPISANGENEFLLDIIDGQLADPVDVTCRKRCASPDGSSPEKRLRTHQHECNMETNTKGKAIKGKSRAKRTPTDDQLSDERAEQPNLITGGNMTVDSHSQSSVSESFTIKELKNVFRKKYNTSEVIYSLTLNGDVNNLAWRDSMDLLGTAIQAVIDRATRGLDDTDLVRVYVNQRGLETPIVLSLRPLHEITVQAVLELIEKMLQSNDTLLFNETFEIHVGCIKMIKGGKGTVITNILADKIKKKSIITVNNKDNMCASRAIVIAKAYYENDKDKRKIAFKNKTLQTQLALELCRKAGVDYSRMCRLDQLHLFERVLDFQIVVVSADSANSIVYKGSETREKKLYLLYHNNHFDVITRMHTFYGSSYYCEVCFKAYQTKSSHRCESKCSMCYETGCKATARVDCRSCNRTFRNLDCYRRHLENKRNIMNGKIVYKSICEKLWLCVKCHKLLNRVKRSPADHICDERYCKTCDVYHMGDHKCFMEPLERKDVSDLIIFCDLETNQEDKTHVVNLAVAHKVCDLCINLENIESPCEQCVQREVVFRGERAMKDFGRWLFSKKHKNYVIICHNMGGFDGYFLLRYLIDQTITPDIIYNGGKIVSMHIKSLNIRIIDSLNLIPTRLRNFPKTFNVPMKKGEFPHLFNIRAHQRYVGEIPDLCYYDVESMSVKDRDAFIEWHSQLKADNYVFDFQKEILEYCRADVSILRICCLKFRALIMDITKPEPTAMDVINEVEPQGIDCFQYVTIASLCFAIFKTMFLRPNEIALVPAGGILPGDSYSKISIQWLEWIVYQDKLKGGQLYIQHALNEGEYRIPGTKFKADGYDKANNTIYEFLGSSFHGDPALYSPDTVNTQTGTTMQYLYDKTIARQRKITEMGYKYVCVWESEFRQTLKSDVRVKDYVDTLDLETRLDARDAFYGGRTGCTKLLYEADDKTKVSYLDFTSLYPSVNVSAEYPIGYPEVITRDFADIRTYVGFIKCKIVPPRNLYHPLLPTRLHNRLMFLLCKKCGENLQQSKCEHSDAERALTGTWVSHEVIKALDLGYKILRVYEVYHFPQTVQYDGKNDNTGLFTGYINTFLKIKQEASGYPEWVKSEAEKNEYIRVYEEKEGIKLDKCNIARNEGLRSVAKLALNSLWGKFGQRNGLNQNTFITSADEFYKLINDPTKEVQDFHDINDEIVLLDWKAKKEFTPTNASSNVFIAAFTTAHASLKLYSVLEELQTRVAYYDTDSVIFSTSEGEKDIECGIFLGQLTSELDPGDTITTFVSAGPKNYSLKTKFGKTVTKVRGFTLNAKNSKVINFDTVISMVKNILNVCRCKDSGKACDLCQRSVYNERKITRHKTKIEIFNKFERKDYRVNYFKRVIQPNLDTLPYGF